MQKIRCVALFFFVVVVLYLPHPTLAATIMSTVDFESSATLTELLNRDNECTYDCFGTFALDANPNALKLVTDVVRAGRKALRMEVDTRLPYTDEGKPRVDITLRHNTMTLRHGEDW